jgi:hypothetical protein
VSSLIDFVVRAYYEVNGSFEKISMFKYFSRIQEAAKKDGVGVEEYCFRCLGYSYDNMYSSEYRYSVRKEAARESLEKFRSRFSVPKTKDIMPVLRTYGFMPMFRKGVDSPQQLGKLGSAAKVIAKYIETTEHVTMFSQSEKKSVPLVNFFCPLKFYPDFQKLSKAIPQYAEIGKRILGNVIVFDGMEDDAKVVDGVILVSKKFDIGKLAEAVCLQIGCRWYDLPKKHYYYLVSKMPFYQANSKSNASVYLGMLDLAHVYGVTLKELFESVGIKYVDQLEVLEESGVFVYQVSDTQFEVLNPLEGDSFLHKVELDRLQSMFVSDTLRYVGVDVLSGDDYTSLKEELLRK